MAESSPEITRARWDDGKKAVLNGGVDMIVSLKGIKKPSTITFTIFETSNGKDGNKKVGTLELKNVPKGATSARLNWPVKYEAEKNVTRGFPEYSFTAVLSPGGAKRSSEKDLLFDARLDKPTWQAKPGTKTPQPTTPGFTAFFTRTEPIDMLIPGDGLGPFLFDFHVFCTPQGASKPVYLVTVPGVRPESASLVRGEFSLKLVDNPQQYLEVPFNFTYTFRLEGDKVAPPPTTLPTDFDFVANQAKCVGQVGLKFISGPARIARSGRILEYKFEVTGASDDFPLTLDGITQDVNVSVKTCDPPRIDQSPQTVILPLEAPKTTEPQMGTLRALILDVGAPVKTMFLAELTIPVIFNEKIDFKLEYLAADKKREVDDRYAAGLPLSINITVKNPQAVPVDISLSIQQANGDYKVHTSRKAFTGSPFSDTINPSDYEVAPVFRAIVEAVYDGEVLDSLTIEYTPTPRVVLSSVGLISTSFDSKMAYMLPFEVLHERTTGTATFEVKVEEFDGSQFVPVPTITLFSRLEFDPGQISFTSADLATDPVSLIFEPQQVTQTTLVQVKVLVSINDPACNPVAFPQSFQFNLNP